MVKKIFLLALMFTVSLAFPQIARATVTQYYDSAEGQFRVGDSADQGRFFGSNGEVHLRRETGNPTLRLLGIGTDHNPYLAFDRVGGTYANPTRTLANMLMGSVVVTGYDGVNQSVIHGSQIKFLATEDWTTSGVGSKIEFHTTPNQSLSQFKAMEIEDRRVKVTGETVYSSAPTSGTVTGETFAFTAGESFNFGEIGYFDANGKISKANAANLTTMNHAVVASKAISGNTSSEFLTKGVVNDSQLDLTVGAPVYLATSSGQISQIAPAQNVQRLGVALTHDSYYFDPVSVAGEVGIPVTQIEYDSTSALATVGSTLTMPHTTGTGSDRILIAFVALQTGRTITSVTYNGTAMTELSSQSLGGSSFDVFKTYYLLNPSSGNHNIVVSSSSSGFIWGYAQSLANVHQVAPYLVNTCLQTSGASLSCGVTTTSEDNWIVGATQDASSNYAVSASSGTYIRMTHPAGWGAIADKNGLKSSGSNNISVTVPSATRFGTNMVALEPSP